MAAVDPDDPIWYLIPVPAVVPIDSEPTVSYLVTSVPTALQMTRCPAGKPK
ncbi:unnamed protein product [Staurois parvus]|uniref:Uncharacterized protein n=1 Tax=Staurois parvus TaxID=386267 RepID=A0ABN9CMV8_9NEOB|nr:unnamed protein product [Staurois parvus]